MNHRIQVSKKMFCIMLIMMISLVGCNTRTLKKKQDGPPKHIPANLLKTPNAIPKVEPFSRCGNRFGKKGKSNTYVALNKRYRVLPTSRGYRARGLASWYGTQFHGRRTSNGERYNMFAMTAAHPSLPLPTYAKVTNLDNGKSVIVKVNDRGPFHKNRLIDLSYVAAAKLGILKKGTGRVEVESIDPRDHGGRVPKKHRSIALKASNQKPMPLYKKAVRKPSSLYLQLGKFNYRAKAEDLVKKLQKISSTPTYVMQQGTAKAPIFRVRVGPIHNDEAAIKLTQKMAQAKLPTPVVIKAYP